MDDEKAWDKKGKHFITKYFLWDCREKRETQLKYFIFVLNFLYISHQNTQVIWLEIQKSCKREWVIIRGQIDGYDIRRIILE